MNATIISALLVCVFLLIVFRLIPHVPKSRATDNPSAAARLSRVRNASFVIFICTGLMMLVGIYAVLGFYFGWSSFGGSHHMTLTVSRGHVYSSPSEIPPEIYWLLLVKQGLVFFAFGAMLRLFWLYWKGILFTAKNVNCLRFLGYYCVVNWFVDFQIQSRFRDVDMSANPILVGFLIIFIAWIMDEGRKIQEEQELTV